MSNIFKILKDFLAISKIGNIFLENIPEIDKFL